MIQGAAMAIFARRKSEATNAAVRVEAAGAVSSGGDVVSARDERRVHALGAEVLQLSRGSGAGVLSRKFWSDKLMAWAMRDEAFKVQLFRFVDAFPTLRTSEAVHDHLVDYLTQPGVTLPPGLDLGMKAGGVAKGLLSATVSSQIKSMASKFIAGVDAADALPGLHKLWSKGIAFSVDLLGEACVSDAEADAYAEKYLDLIRTLPDAVKAWPANDRLERDHLGVVPRVNVSIKISSLSSRCDPIDPDYAMGDIMSRLIPILEEAASHNVFINFDMESHDLKDFTIDLFERCCAKVEFDAGLALQAYLRSGDDDARRVANWAQREGRRVTVRLVKGAYWDYETIVAEMRNWPCPVWGEKHETDACFERMVETLLGAAPRAQDEGGVSLALGSHNARSIAAGLETLERNDLPRAALELQMLHGMADEMKAAVSRMGLRVREYVPVGEMIPGMAYLVRRLLENTSNESWLRAGFVDDASEETLLGSPHTEGVPTDPRARSAPSRHALSPAVEGVGGKGGTEVGEPFMNEPARDFADAVQRDAFASAISAAIVPVVANDSTSEDATRAVSALYDFFPTWRDTPALERAGVLVRTAAAMRKRRDEIAGVMIRESGKTWREADADVCEAIDFCEFYARCAPPMFARHRLGCFTGELNEQWCQPRGVAVVISPWNFPLAICTGMTVAALVTGNTVALKPAEQTPGVAKLFVEMLFASGLPADALRLLPGPGETTGAALVRDPRVALIAFTGSKAVGLDILQAAGVTPDEQMHVKKVVCEMGGKNAIIVDASADLDEAVVGVRDSAFSFQGQKCSACSRVIVVDSAYDTFVDRLVESTRALRIGDPIEPSTDVGPVIDDEAREKCLRYIALGKQDGATLALAMETPSGLVSRVSKPYIPPHIFIDVKPEHAIAREEIFGPVLAVLRVRDFDEALALANASPYKLTGGVFSRKPTHLERAKREFRVGNLYINRSITGALVGRQPFGGFGLSGVGTKAGGRDYLEHFVEPRVSCENTMRRGFAPEL